MQRAMPSAHAYTQFNNIPMNFITDRHTYNSKYKHIHPQRSNPTLTLPIRLGKSHDSGKEGRNRNRTPLQITITFAYLVATNTPPPPTNHPRPVGLFPNGQLDRQTKSRHAAIIFPLPYLQSPDAVVFVILLLSLPPAGSPNPLSLTGFAISIDTK